jgi:hypothetical protein
MRSNSGVTQLTEQVQIWVIVGTTCSKAIGDNMEIESKWQGK